MLSVTVVKLRTLLRKRSATGTFMEGFIDDYRHLRLAMAVASLVLLIAMAVLDGWTVQTTIYSMVLLLMAAHASWHLVKGVRAPRLALAVDMTSIGAASLFSEANPTVGLIFALWCVLITFLTMGRARIAFYGYATAWYLIESSRLVPVPEAQVTISKLFIVAVMVAILLAIHRRMQLLEIQRSQLLGSVSHELRNQLTGVIGMIDLALPEDAGLTHEEVRDLIGLARREAMDASALIEDLLTASRMEGNALDVHLEAIDADIEVARIIDHYPAEGMTFRQIGTRTGVVALGDQVRLRQILRNLLSNATRYGGKDVTLSVTPGESTVLINVSDDGPGVPAGETETIFLPYRRAANTPRHRSSVGIGLWVSRKLARAMHGDLTYRRENERTIFEIRLPTYPPTRRSDDSVVTQRDGDRASPKRRPIDQTTA